MTDTQTTAPSPAPAAAEPTSADFPERVNRKIKGQIVEHGMKFTAIEAGIGMSHAAAARRSLGQNEWSLSEIERFADWLNLDVDITFRPRS